MSGTERGGRDILGDVLAVLLVDLEAAEPVRAAKQGERLHDCKRSPDREVDEFRVAPVVERSRRRRRIWPGEKRARY